MQKSGLRDHHVHGHIRQGLLGGIILDHRTHGDSHRNQYHLMPQHMS